MAAVTGQRAYYVDNLRLAMIVLVVLVHAGVTVSGLGSWYYVDPAPKGPLSFLALTLFQAGCQSFFMGLLFFLAGYYARASLLKKGGVEFVRGRLVRLGLPALFYMAVLNPLTIYWLADSSGVQGRMGFGTFLAGYFAKGYVFGGSGPLWFALALLAFCLAYAGLRGLLPRRDPGPARPFGGRQALGLALLCFAGTFLVRLRWPMGSAVLNMQLPYFTQYVLFFAWGLAAHGNGWLQSLDAGLARRCLLLGAAGLALLAVTIWPAASAPDVAAALAPFRGGWTWQAAFLSAWEGGMGVALSVGFLGLFRERCNGTGPFLKGLTDSAFAVYVFHAPLVVVLGRLLVPRLEAPALAKFLVLGALSLPVSFAAAWLVRRTPLLKDLVKA